MSEYPLLKGSRIFLGTLVLTGFMMAVTIPGSASLEIYGEQKLAHMGFQWPVRPGATAQPVYEAGNRFYRIAVLDFPSYGVGSYTVTTGPDHPAGPYLNILYGDGFPGTSYSTVHSYTSGTDYVQISLLTPSVRLRLLEEFLASITPVGTTGLRATYVLPGPPLTPDKLTIVSDIAVNGSTLNDSSVEVTTRVTNNGAALVSIGVRYLWDMKVDQDDGPTFQEINPNTGLRQTEIGFFVPRFAEFRMQDNDISLRPPTFFTFGTVTPACAVRPTPTLPDLLQFVCWSSVVAEPFNYRPDPSVNIVLDGVPCQMGSQGGDSAVLYFFGSRQETALSIPPGMSQAVSASMWARPIN